MLRRFEHRAIRVLGLLAATAGHLHASPERDRPVSFDLDVRPILSDKCFLCHGPDEATREADLRLDTEEGIQEAFVEGDLDNSEAWSRIHSEEEYEVMPPPELGKPLSSEDLATLRTWMEQGAPWAGHWAFTPPVRPTLPDSAKSVHPIDAFLDKRLNTSNLEANPMGSPEKLARRLSLDLTGLPLEPAELDAFLADASPEAWNRLIDRLLASPHYGERMAVDWLDGARYADTNGYQNDFARHMWRWRDWVIQAFQQNMPFDDFTIQQIAGDMLPNPTRDQIIATAFNRNNRTVTEGGSLPEEWLVENVVDRVETTGTVFLGLTMGCARCHDHKYDPISQRDFFSFFAFFHNVNELGVYNEARGNVRPLLFILDEQQQAVHDEHLRHAQESQEELSEAEAIARDRVAGWFDATPAPSPRRREIAGIPLASDFLAYRDESRFEPNLGAATSPKPVDSFPARATRFDGTTWLVYPDFTPVDFDKPFTISCWIKPNGPGSIVNTIDQENAERGVELFVEKDLTVSARLVASWPEDSVKIKTKQKLPKGRWTQLSLTSDGSGSAKGLLAFFDGQQQKVGVPKDALSHSVASQAPLRVGRRSGGPTLKAKLSRLRFYDEALSPEDLRLSALNDGLQSQDDSELHVEDRLHFYEIYSEQPEAEKVRQRRRTLNKANAQLARFEADKPSLMVMEELAEPRETYVLRRGEYDKPDKQQQVSSAVPGFLGAIPGQERPTRLHLAQWLTSKANPLTSRVTVNRLWNQFFGVGLVKTTEDFGVQGERPSHPELLDWLAVELIESGWDLQHIIRLIVTSDAYRRSSVASAQQLQIDPENRLLSRGPRRRLAAEFVRDNSLAVSGLLTKTIGGPSVFPYQPEGLWGELAGGAGQGPYTRSEGDALYRRSLYTYRKRTVPHPTMSTFDAPSFEICTVRRSTTNTPLQALALLNDTTYVEAARALGLRMIDEGGEDVDARLTYGFRLATGRRPDARELDVLSRAWRRYVDAFAADEQAAAEFLSIGEQEVDAQEEAVETAAYAMVGSLLLNLDETISVE